MVFNALFISIRNVEEVEGAAVHCKLFFSPAVYTLECRKSVLYVSPYINKIKFQTFAVV